MTTRQNTTIVRKQNTFYQFNYALIGDLKNMDMNQQLIIMNLGLVGATILALIYFVTKSKLKQSGQLSIKRKHQIHNRFVFYSNNVLLRKRFRAIVKQYASLSCYDLDTIKSESVNLFEKSCLTACAMPIASLFVVQDVSFAILVSFVGYIYYDMAVEKRLDKLNKEIMTEISNCIQSISERYMETDNIPNAVLQSDKGKYLEKPITRMFEMLTDVNSAERLEEFNRTSPIRLLKTLATTCYLVNETGDERLERGSVFIEEMTIIRHEADYEIQRLEDIRIAFKSLAIIAMLGLIVFPMCEAFLLSKIPGTSLLIKGIYGMVVRSVIVGITILAYYVISIINKPSVVNTVDKIEFLDNLSKHKLVKPYIVDIMPKKRRSRGKKEQLINNSLSSKTLPYIYTSKVFFSACAFVLMLVFLWVFTITAKSYLYNNYRSLDFIPNAAMEERVLRQVKKLDTEYLDMYPNKPNDEETLTMVKATIQGMKELEYMKQAERVSLKYDTYYEMGFKWWYILIAYAAALLASKAPEASLKFRKKLVAFEASEDVLQLQTLMIVLSNTSMDVFKALYWMERQSSIHKAPLRFAYHEYTSDPEGALYRLRKSTNQPEFKRLISKLETAIYALSLGDSFIDMKLNKEQTLNLREKILREQLGSKKQWAKLIAMVPTAIVLIFDFVGPILALGISQLAKTVAELELM